MENYSRTIQLNTTPDNLFRALTIEIPRWWTAMFEGAANHRGDTFTVRFGDNVYKTIRVEELALDSKTVWKVIDSLIAVPGLKNQTEWIGTTIVWDLTPGENSTKLQLTHIGFHPGFECYEICIAGWKQFIDSLKLFVETGEGRPFKP